MPNTVSPLINIHSTICVKTNDNDSVNKKAGMFITNGNETFTCQPYTLMGKDGRIGQRAHY